MSVNYALSQGRYRFIDSTYNQSYAPAAIFTAGVSFTKGLEMNTGTKAKLQLITSLLIFGTIGTLRRNILLPTSLIVVSRGIIASLFLLFLHIFKRQSFNKKLIRKRLPYLLLSGAALGFNWMLCFESYRFTTVAIGVLCLYMGPIFLLMMSPFLLNEKLSFKKMFCILIAFLGMILVSGIINTGLSDISEIKGILLGLGAAVLYTPIVYLNIKNTDVPANDKTIIQLLAATLIMLPYALLTIKREQLLFTYDSILLLLILSIVHTGIAYSLYFDSMKNIDAQSIAILSYIDPVVSILLSVFFLHEAIAITGIIGAVMILGATLINELPGK